MSVNIQVSQVSCPDHLGEQQLVGPRMIAMGELAACPPVMGACDAFKLLAVDLCNCNYQNWGPASRGGSQWNTRYRDNPDGLPPPDRQL